MEDPQDFAGEKATVTSMYVPVASCVSLRCIRFEPHNAAPHPPILFVPGWISLMNSWRYFLPCLTATCSVIYVESREKYSSRIRCRTQFAVADLARDIIQLVQHFDLAEKQYILAGSSLGATSILEAAPELPVQPQGLGLILPNSRFHLPPHTPLLKYLPARLLPLIKRVAQTIVYRLKMNPTDLGQQERFLAAMSFANANKLRDSAVGLYEYDLSLERLGQIQTPSLVIGASHDKLHDQAEVKQIAEHLPRGEYQDLKTFTASHSTEAARALLLFSQRLSKQNL